MIGVAFGLGQRTVRRTVVGDLSLENRSRSRARFAAALFALDVVQRPGEGSWQQNLTRVLDMPPATVSVSLESHPGQASIESTSWKP